MCASLSSIVGRRVMVSPGSRFDTRRVCGGLTAGILKIDGPLTEMRRSDSTSRTVGMVSSSTRMTSRACCIYDSSYGSISVYTNKRFYVSSASVHGGEYQNPKESVAGILGLSMVLFALYFYMTVDIAIPTVGTVESYELSDGYVVKFVDWKLF